MKAPQTIGLDFGTTNSAIAFAQPMHDAVLANFKNGANSTTSFRSVLYFPFSERGSKSKLAQALTGPEAISNYLDAEDKGRLIVSIKSYLGSELFTSTSINGRNYGLEELIAIIMRKLRSAAIEQFNVPATKAVLGRPVRFVGTNSASHNAEKLALDRLTRAAGLAGFEEILFELEPIAAALQFERNLDHDELVFVADFGGGTSDFTLMNLGPSRRKGSSTNSGVLGTDGLAFAGDAFDSTIMENVIAPILGMGTHYISLGKTFPIPAWIYSQLSSWHQMSFLRAPEAMSVLKQVNVQALEKEKIESLIYIISHNLGYELYRAVERVKVALSAQESATFFFENGPISIEAAIQRSKFESWILPYVDSIGICVTRLLESCNVSASDVDSVFLTGGSSFVPAIRRLFANKFDKARLRSGEELTAVAKGLALSAVEGT